MSHVCCIQQAKEMVWAIRQKSVAGVPRDPHTYHQALVRVGETNS